MNKRFCRCGCPLSNERRAVTRLIQGRGITIDNVPVLYCATCEETLYTAKTIKKMDELIQNNPGELALVYPNALELKPTVIHFLDELETEEKEKILQEGDEPLTKVDLANLIALLKSKGEVA